MMSLALRGGRCGRGVEGVRGKGEAESFPLREEAEVVFCGSGWETASPLEHGFNGTDAWNMGLTGRTRRMGRMGRAHGRPNRSPKPPDAPTTK